MTAWRRIAWHNEWQSMRRQKCRGIGRVLNLTGSWGRVLRFSLRNHCDSRNDKLCMILTERAFVIRIHVAPQHDEEMSFDRRAEKDKSRLFR